MKKLILIVCMLAVCTASLQAQNQSSQLIPTLNQHIEQVARHAVASAPSNNKGSISQNKRVQFTIEESIRNKGVTYGPYQADIACKAYPLDSHWLILSGTCMRYSNEDIYELGDHKYLERFGRNIIKSSVRPLHHAENSHVMLMWYDNPVYQAPFVNVLATTPAQLFALSATSAVQIHTARMGTDVVRNRTLKTNSAQENTFQLNEKWTDLSGTATDPLFLISPQGDEFLAAYNDGYISYALQMKLDDIFTTYDGLKSDTWFTLTQGDLDFIKTTVLSNRPQDWVNIKTRLFLDNIHAPYYQEYTFSI